MWIRVEGDIQRLQVSDFGIDITISLRVWKMSKVVTLVSGL
jgi:hypothetical protein